MITLEPVWSWPWVVLAAIGLIALVLLTYPKRVRHLEPMQRRMLLGLRLAAALLLILALLRPGVQLSDLDKRDAMLVVISDGSRSMKTPDGPGGITRRAALVNTLEECGPQLDELQEDLEIAYYDFASELSGITSPGGESDGEFTAIGAALEELLRQTKTRNVLGVLLLSDGAQRARGELDVDPGPVARQFGIEQMPIYTVGFGGTTVTGAAMDLSIESIDVKRTVFVKNLVPVDVKVRANGAADRDLTVRLFLEDRTGKRLGETGPLKPISATSTTHPVDRLTPVRSSELLSTKLSFIPERPGEYKLGVEVEPLAGEIKTNNNRMETIITVRKGGVRVAYFDQPLRPEQKFIRRINVAEKIHMDFQPVRPPPFDKRTQIKDEWFDPGEYDVFIIGDVAASALGRERLLKLASLVEEGTGLLMIGGFNSFGPGGYAGTPGQRGPLARLLPVDMDPGEFRGDPLSPELHHQRQLKMMPTREGLKHYVMQIDADGRNGARWESLAPLERGNRLTEPQGGLVQVLARTPDGIPLLLAHDVGPARVAAFAGDTTWLWVSVSNDLDAHQRFWRQLVLWLAHKEFDDERSVWVRVEPRNFSPGQRVPIACGARGEDGAPLDDVSFNVEITAPDGETANVVVARSGAESVGEFVNANTPGDYLVRVRAMRNGEPYMVDAYTRFIVDARDPELDNPAAEYRVLQEIAELSGGDSMTPEQLSARLQAWIDDGVPNLEITRISRISLWDNWPFLSCFVAVMSLEWFVRKRRGLV